MSLSGSVLTPLLYTDYLAIFPNAVSANRQNGDKGISKHNVPFELVAGVSRGFATALLSMKVFDTFAGTVGASTPQLAVPIFNPGIVAAAEVAFLASMGWGGAVANDFASALISSLFTRVSQISQIQMSVYPSLGAGTGVVSAVSNSTLGTEMTSRCKETIIEELQQSGYFSIDDNSGEPITPQVASLVDKLATAYGTVVGGVFSSIVYTGTGSSTPISGTNIGTFI